MPDLRQTRQKLKIAIGSLLAVDALCVALLLSPLIGSQRSRDEQMSQLWKDLQQKTREVEPLRGLDKKIPIAKQQIDDFYQNRFPSETSTVSADLGKLAADSGVKLAGVSYAQKSSETENKDAEAVDLNRMTIDADLSGDYLQVMRFINSLERSRLFFLVDSVQIGSDQGGVIRLRMRLETYLKATST
jgi:type IV pilus assembly protein PilO